MQPHDPSQQQPYYPPPAPVVVVKNKTSVGVWILVAFFVGPPVLIALCCLGASFIGLAGAANATP